VFSGKERPADLRGIFSNAAVLWSALPSECPKNPYLNCGHIDLVFSKSLLGLFKITENPEKERRLNIAAYSRNDGQRRGMARVFAEAGGNKVTFLITSVSNESGGARRLRVKRKFMDGTEEIFQVTKDGIFTAVLDELAGLHKMAIKETDKALFCGACTTKVNGLPGSKI